MKLTVMIVRFLAIYIKWAQAKPVDAVDLANTLPAEETSHDEKLGLQKELDGR